MLPSTKHQISVIRKVLAVSHNNGCFSVSTIAASLMVCNHSQCGLKSRLTEIEVSTEVTIELSSITLWRLLTPRLEAIDST